MDIGTIFNDMVANFDFVIHFSHFLSQSIYNPYGLVVIRFTVDADVTEYVCCWLVSVLLMVLSSDEAFHSGVVMGR